MTVDETAELLNAQGHWAEPGNDLVGIQIDDMRAIAFNPKTRYFSLGYRGDIVARGTFEPCEDRTWAESLDLFVRAFRGNDLLDDFGLMLHSLLRDNE